MGSRAFSPCSTNGWVTAVWCWSVVCAIARGPKSPCEWRSVVVWITGGCLSNDCTFLEDFHRTRGEFLGGKFIITNKIRPEVHKIKHFSLYSRRPFISPLQMKARNYERVEKLFQRCLIKILNIELWKLYLLYVKETKSGLSTHKWEKPIKFVHIYANSPLF